MQCFRQGYQMRMLPVPFERTKSARQGTPRKDVPSRWNSRCEGMEG